MKRIVLMVTVALVMAAMMAISGPASAQGGCKEFGHNVVSEVQASPPAGQFIRTLAPINDVSHAEQAEFCG